MNFPLLWFIKKTKQTNKTNFCVLQCSIASSLTELSTEISTEVQKQMGRGDVQFFTCFISTLFLLGLKKSLPNYVQKDLNQHCMDTSLKLHNALTPLQRPCKHK